MVQCHAFNQVKQQGGKFVKLSLKNIGKIQEANVEINGITVIAGENNTGKSTVGKALYSIFNSFYGIEKQIKSERVQIIERFLDMMVVDHIFRVNTRELAEDIMEHSDKYQHDIESIKAYILKSIYQYDKDFDKVAENSKIEEAIQRISDVFNVSNDEIFKTILNKKLDAEFNGQINNLFSDKQGYIGLEIKGQKISIDVFGNSVIKINNDNKVNLNTEAVYLDDPFVLDEQKSYRFFGFSPYYLDHKIHLKTKLFNSQKDTNVINEIVTNKKFEGIYQKINVICSGDIVRNGRSTWGYRKDNTDKVFDIKNISTGLKTFVILKTLLVNGTIESNGTIILDEPEIHLHPEWQLIFAELIVLIQKEFGMHVLLNTHSPYFLRAIQVYSAKYEIADKCKYYLSALNNDQAIISDVTSEIDKIYKKLSYPLQQLEDERWQDD